MSAEDALGRQWPRVQLPIWAASSEHDVHPAETYGGQVMTPGDESSLRKTRPFESLPDEPRRVPIDKVDFGQQRVDRTHVEKLAAMPAHLFTGADAPIVKEHPFDGGGYFAEDGNHRLAAARQRGDTHIEVRVRGRYGARYDGL